MTETVDPVGAGASKGGPRLPTTRAPRGHGAHGAPGALALTLGRGSVLGPRRGPCGRLSR